MASSESSVSLCIISAGVVIATLYALRNHLTAKTQPPLPPGPRGLPILGNARDFASPSLWLVFDKWFKQYGDVLYVSLLGQPVLLLGSYEVTQDLLEHRGTIYSDRKQSVMFGTLMDCGGIILFQPYGDDWRRSRKMLHSRLHSNAVTQYQPIQIAAARTFVRELLRTEPSPDVLVAMIAADFAETILKIVYGISVETEEDKAKYINDPTNLVEMMVEAGTPGRFFVDGLSFLQYVPSWMPGAGFQTFAKKAKHLWHKSREAPMKFVRSQMINGTAPISMVRDMLEDTSPDDQIAQDTIRNLGAAIFHAGSDTTVVTMQAFFLGMLRYPEAQWAAQAEIDAVLGHRLPTLGDRKALPYVEAILLETLRWLPAVPEGIPHMTSADDTYRGCLIPKGTLVFGVAWALLHDPVAYERPDDFLPQRFLRRTSMGTHALDPAVRDPRCAAFGYGRRLCPGRHLAEQGLWATMATILASVDILPAIDEEGKDIIPPVSLVKGLVTRPRPFPYRVRPRSAKSTSLLREDLL